MNDRGESRSSVPPRESLRGDNSDDATVISAPESASQRSGGTGGSTAPRAAESRTSTTDIGRLLEGTMLGPFRLDRFIGGGGMGAVFQALDTSLHRTVAIKVLARHQSDDEENLRRFRIEAQSAARLDHENIGRVYAVGGDQGWHYIVLEYIEGTNLRDLVREEGAFDPSRTVDVAIQVAEALEHASERNVVHRDIKPSNIVVTPTGRARIVDMGLARLHQMAGDAELTVSGMTLGTFDYISPEQARDPRDADVRSDLYSLGCTMFFMLAGRPPFAEGTMVQKLLQHQQAEPPAIDEIRRDVPRSLAEIVLRLMEKDPADRYQRPADLVAALVACAEAEGFQLSAPRLTPAVVTPSIPKTSRLPWAIPLALMVVLIGLLWIRSATIRRSEPTPLSSDDAASVETNVIPATVPVTVVSDAQALGQAILGGGDNGVIEITGDGTFDVAAFSIAGRRLELRSAAGHKPVLRVAGGPDGTAITIGNGRLRLSGVAVHGGEQPSRAGRRQSLFSIQGGSLMCEAVILRMPTGPTGGAEPRSCIHVSESAIPTGSARAVIDFRGVRVEGNSTVATVDMPGGGRLDFSWDTGVALTRRLIEAEGSTSGDVMIDGRFTDLVASCSDDLLTFRDEPARPRVPRLGMQATGCRFIVTDPARAFVEQAGVADPEAYAAALVWTDRHGRYEGTQIFRRIDGAAERIEMLFGEPSAPLVHDAQVGTVPDASGWEDLRP